MNEHPHLKRNFILNTLDGVTFFLGMIFLSMENVIPVYLSQLGASPFIISLIPAIRNIGVFFPSIFVARRIQAMSFQKGWLVKWGLLQRIPWLFSGLLCFFFASDHPQAAVFSIVLAIFLTNLGAGITVPSFFYFTAKTIPLSLRGKLFALRNIISYLIGFLCGAFITRILTVVAFPLNFSVLMLIGFSITMIYLPAIILQVEPKAGQIHFAVESWRQYFNRLNRMIKSDRDLQFYIAGRVFFTLSFAVNNYLAVFTVSRYTLSDNSVGLFAIITAGVFLVVNPVLGVLSDRCGHLFNHYLGSAALTAAPLIAVFSHSYILSLTSIALGAFVLCVQNVSCFSLPMEFGEDHEIPIYVSLVGLFVGAVSLFIILFAFIAEHYGYIPVFLICSFCGAVSFLFFAGMKEPRRRVTPPVRDL